MRLMTRYGNLAYFQEPQDYLVGYLHQQPEQVSDPVRMKIVACVHICNS
jgi:hypothetical protein